MMHRTKKKNDENSGKWIGIGGKFLEDESPDECMIREVFEETAIVLESWRYRGVITFVSDLWETEYMHLFTAFSNTDEVSDCAEGELRWIDKNAIDELSLWQGDRVFLDIIKNDNAGFFSLKLVYKGDSLCRAVLDGNEIDFNGGR